MYTLHPSCNHIVHWSLRIVLSELGQCRAPLHEECLQHLEHKGDPGVTDTRDLWCCWWEDPNDPSVGEGPGVKNASYPWRLGVMRVRHELCVAFDAWILNAQEYLNRRCEVGDMTIWVGHCLWTTPWNMSGRHGSGSRNYHILNIHNFLNICPIGANDMFIDIYPKSRCRWSSHL